MKEFRTKSGKVSVYSIGPATEGTHEPDPSINPESLKAPDNVRGEIIDLLRDALIAIEEDDKPRAVDLVRQAVRLVHDEKDYFEGNQPRLGGENET